ncbi:hypothetical protein [Halomicrobium sp. LC1Hm]|uniref:hypothetical protein n=1 Tax=Halomicrobium sp. LC1Hm TaxID=2610902 RepID=UPI001298284A|nr:hypothetical protein [Halomicrobium sp. LC1Hm]
MSVDQRITLLQATFTGIAPPYPSGVYNNKRKRDIRHRLSERGLMYWNAGDKYPEVTSKGKKVALEILKEIDEEKYEQAQSEVMAGNI